MCDRAAETCPVFPGDPERIDWTFGDPAVVPSGPEQRLAFDKIASELTGRMRIWMALSSFLERTACVALSTLWELRSPTKGRGRDEGGDWT